MILADATHNLRPSRIDMTPPVRNLTSTATRQQPLCAPDAAATACVASSSPSSSSAASTDAPAKPEQREHAGNGPSVAASPTTKPAQPRVDRLPPWRVILHNDDVNDIGFVVETIIELLRVNPRQALLCTLTAHRTGLCHLMSTHREKAELLRDQFRSKSLTVTIEPEG